MKRFAIIASLCLMLFGIAGKASAQILPDVPDMKGKLVVGGDFDLGLYGNYFNFGIAPYTNCQVYKGLFLHVEDEVMYGLSRYNHSTTGSSWFNSLFVGGGLRQYAYNGSYVYYMVLYNLSWGGIVAGNWGTPYSSPIAMRVGYCFCF